MTALVLRTTYGSPLSITQMDTNLTAINGNSAGLTGITTTTTLLGGTGVASSNNLGQIVELNAAVACTMPLASTAASGSIIQFVSTVNGATVVAQSTDTFLAGATSLTTFTLNIGDSLELVSNGTGQWVAASGTVIFPYSAAASTLVNGLQNIPVGGNTNVTLTPIQGAAQIMELTGVLTGSINVIVPTVNKTFTVWNNTSGAYTITVKTSGGTGIIVNQGKTQELICEGTNVIIASNDLLGAGIASLGANIYSGTQTATSFSGAGTGLTGTASGLTVGTANALNPANAYSIAPATLDAHAAQAVQIQSGAFTTLVDTGTANAYVATFTPALSTPVPGAPFWMNVKTANTGASTLNATGTAYPIVGAAHSALQGGEMIANAWALIAWNATLSSYVLIECTGAVLQVPARSYGATPAQFDNTTKLATTAFIRQDAGSLSGVITPSSSATLTLAELGNLIFFNGSIASQTITLPAVASVPNGYGYWFQNVANVPVTIKANAAEQIYLVSVGSVYNVNSFSLGVGESTFFVSLGYWWYEQQGARANSAGGIGCPAQSWQNVTASRSLSTTYTNSTGRPILVAITITSAAGTGATGIIFTISGVGQPAPLNYVVGAGYSIKDTVLIQPGATYSTAVSGGVGGTLSTWFELR